MKIIEKITLTIYSIIMLIAAILTCLLIFGWLDMGLAGGLVKDIIIGETSRNVLLAVNILFILLSIKCIFFSSSSKEKSSVKEGVLLQNDNGKLMISKETIENLVNSVALNFQSAEDVVTRVELDRENKVKVYVNLIVSADVVIKELSTNLQNKIKEKVKKATDLDVNEVNITVKKVAPKEQAE